MKKNRFVFALMLLCAGNEYGAAFTPRLVESAVATCSFAVPQAGVAHAYCLPSNIEQETVCFSTAAQRDDYELFAGTDPAFLPALSYVLAGKAVPTVSCQSRDSRAVPNDLVCIGADFNQENEKTCFERLPFSCHSSRSEPGITYCFENQHELAQHIRQQNLQERLSWTYFLLRSQQYLTLCTDVQQAKDVVDDYASICPLKHESLDAYVSRMFVKAKEMSAGAIEPCLQDVITEQSSLWLVHPNTAVDIPWHIKSYLLAVDIEMQGKSVLNNLVLFPNITPLDYAARHNEEDLVYWLWDKGARATTSADTLKAIKTALLKTNNERSLHMLKSMIDEGISFKEEWATVEWAPDLDPELVWKKMRIIGDSYCDVQCDVEHHRNDTPGAQALIDWAQSRRKCHKCVIL